MGELERNICFQSVNELSGTRALVSGWDDAICMNAGASLSGIQDVSPAGSAEGLTR